MKDSFLSARLVEPNLIRLVIFSDASFEKIYPTLVVDHKERVVLHEARHVSMGAIVIYDYRLEEPLALGHNYILTMNNYGCTGIDVQEATSFPNFDRDYYYDGDDLGVTYTKEKTSFALWAPLASTVTLKYRMPEEKEWRYTPLKRTEKGVYRLELKGDQEGLLYRYLVINSEILKETHDPYAKGSTLNGEDSVVVDFEKLKIDLNEDQLPTPHHATSAVVYEGHVRDLTIDPSTNIKHKGTFLGLAEEGRTTEKGHPAGLDYLSYLGINYLQLLPIYDFKTVDEKDPSKTYNWGYDPSQYFVPEGSYASKLEDPLSRIKDLKKLVAALHSRGIRLVMDVVYNHVYDYQNSVFEAVVPNYYFRKKYNGKIASTSGCGNDLATERPMVRKMIVDCCKWWVKTYGVDGFRFDLMGIIDIPTLKKIQEEVRAIKPSFLLYGEGWNMGGEVKELLGHMDHAAMLPEYGFFNDTFRNNAKAYFAGDMGAMQNFKASYASLSLPFILAKKFVNANQSVNYVECHDNETYFDYLTMRNPDSSLDEKLERCKLALAGVLFSYGMPFIHAGQEIAMSKWGHGNTYNKGDGYNKFSYRLLDERWAMATYAHDLIAFRKKTRWLQVYDPRVIDTLVDIRDLGNIVHVSYIEANIIAPYKRVEVFFNPTDQDWQYTASEPLGVKVSNVGCPSETKKKKDVVIPKRSFVLLGA